MTWKIQLRLVGIDLRDVNAYERIPVELAELSFEANGAVSVAVVYSESVHPSREAADWARAIGRYVPGVHVVGVHDELVSTSDIAARCDVAAEAVRLWASGRRRQASRPFPPPREVVGTGTGGKGMNVYSWADVVAWVRDVLGFDPDEGIDYLDARRCAHLNAELADLAADSMAGGWRAMMATNSAVIASADPARATAAVTVARSTMTLLTRIEDVLDDDTPSRGRTGRVVC